MQSGIPDFDTANPDPAEGNPDPFRAQVYADPAHDYSVRRPVHKESGASRFQSCTVHVS